MASLAEVGVLAAPWNFSELGDVMRLTVVVFGVDVERLLQRLVGLVV